MNRFWFSMIYRFIVGSAVHLYHGDLTNTTYMCFLFEIPRDVYNMIFSEWLDLKDIGMLDCAVSQRDSRLLWLEQLKNPLMKVETKSHSLSVKCLNWMFSREFPLHHVEWNREYYGCFNRLLCRVNFNKIKSIAMWIDDIAIINRCVNLTALKCSYKLFGNIKPSLAQNLLKLVLDLNYIDRTHISSILPALCCQNLRVLHTYGLPDYLYGILIDIIKQNPRLEGIKTTGNLMMLEAIFKCETLKQLQFMTMTEDFTEILINYSYVWNNLELFHAHLNSYIIYITNKKKVNKNIKTVSATFIDCEELLCQIREISEVDIVYCSQSLIFAWLMLSSNTLESVTIEHNNLDVQSICSILKVCNLTELNLSRDYSLNNIDINQVIKELKPPMKRISLRNMLSHGNSFSLLISVSLLFDTVNTLEEFNFCGRPVPVLINILKHYYCITTQSNGFNIKFDWNEEEFDFSFI